VSENGERRYLDSLLPNLSRAIDLGSWALRWRKLWANEIEIRTGTVTDAPSAGTDIVNKTYADSISASMTVEEVDGSPSYTDITTLRFDQTDGFVVTNPSAGVARIDVSIPAALTVEELDGTPSVTDVDTLQFDQADGFIVTDETGGVAKVALDNIPVTLLDGSFTDLGSTLTGELPVADGGTGSGTAAGAATNLGLGTGDSPQFTAIELGHATDTTVSRVAAGGDIAVEGNTVYRAGGTDVPVTDGGTGSSTAAGARTNLDVPSNAEAILDTLFDAKGDLISASAANTPALLAVGTDHQVLIADASETTGLAWGPTAGTWTPTLSFVTPGNLSVAYSAQDGQYIRIGNWVLLHFIIITSTWTHTTASGQLQMSGLPFAAATTNVRSAVAQSSGITRAGMTFIAATSAPGETYMRFETSGPGVSVAEADTTNAASGTQQRIGGVIWYAV
jgi:hypothetical protein